MSDEIRAQIKSAAKALCHYASGPSDVNSCCPGIGRCEMDAAIAEIASLRAWRDTINSRLTSWMHPVLDGEEPHDALMRLLDFEQRAFCDPAVSQAAADLVATARREGMEEAAGKARIMASVVSSPSAQNALRFFADSIRAAAKEGKP